MQFFTLLILLLGTFVTSGASAENILPALGRLASNFTLHDDHNHPIELDSYRGKKILLHFWAPSCFVCPEEVQALERLQKRFGNQLSQIVTVISFERSEKSVQKVSEMKLSLPVLFDTDNTVAVLFGVKTLPETFLIDEQGKFIEISDPQEPEKKNFRLRGPRDWGSEKAISSLRQSGFIP